MSNSQYPEGIKDTFLCLTGINAWPYTHVVSVEDGKPTVETRCIKKDSYAEQKGNAIDTASNAAQAKYMTGAQGAAVVTGTGALAGGLSYLGITKAMLQEDYNWYKSYGAHKRKSRHKEINDCLEKLDWGKYDNFESALKGEGTKCSFYRALPSKK